MSEVAQRMQLRHPNIATVMGVATEPVTEDLILVSIAVAPSPVCRTVPFALPPVAPPESLPWLSLRFMPVTCIECCDCMMEWLLNLGCQ